jgi:50S ribosomal subunit-associated GTPase HflX
LVGNKQALPAILAINKMDLVGAIRDQILVDFPDKYYDVVPVSALTSEYVDGLFTKVAKIASTLSEPRRLSLDVTEVPKDEGSSCC